MVSKAFEATPNRLESDPVKPAKSAPAQFRFHGRGTAPWLGRGSDRDMAGGAGRTPPGRGRAAGYGLSSSTRTSAGKPVVGPTRRANSVTPSSWAAPKRKSSVVK